LAVGLTHPIVAILKVVDGDPIWLNPKAPPQPPPIKLALQWKITNISLMIRKAGTSRPANASFYPLDGTNDGDRKTSCSEQGQREAEHGPKNPGRQKPLKHELTQTCAFS
jgi:hypothetical protein